MYFIEFQYVLCKVHVIYQYVLLYGLQPCLQSQYKVVACYFWGTFCHVFGPHLVHFVRETFGIYMVVTFNKLDYHAKF